VRTLPVRMECTTLLLSHMDAPDWPSLATQLCCRMLAQRCRSRHTPLNPCNRCNASKMH
jgi:hypothetical protein